MPTIAEIIAAKKAATQGGSVPSSAPRETIAEQMDTREAIDRIDPPGKRERAAAARKTAGIILSRDLPAETPNGEPRGQATPIAGPEAPRSLGASEGESIDVTPLQADPAIRNWHKAANAFATDLVIMRDPIDPERAWLAVRLDDEPLHPLLIKDLPIYDHPRAFRKPNEPF